MRLVGVSHPIQDARGKATGRARYAADMSLPHMTHVAMVFSTIPHGYVTAVDGSEALAVEGVYGVFHCFNTPEYCFNRYRSQYSQTLPLEEPVFAKRVRFVGDRVAAVAARDMETARRAAALVKVTYEELPCALTFEEALEGVNCLEGEEAVKDEFTVEVGEPPRADGLVEVTACTELGRLHHAAMEPHVCVADYDSDLDELTLYSPNQSVHGVRTVVADMLEMPYNRVRVVKTTMGGSFGSKQEWTVEPVAAAVARRLRRPVKLVYDRAEVMRSIVCRGPMRAEMTMRFHTDGLLASVELELLSDAGAYIANSADYARTLVGKMFRCYRIPYGRAHIRLVSSNTPVSGSFRGWSSPEVALMLEHGMEKAARALDMDPVQLRLKNVLLPGDTDPKSGVPIEEIRTRECLLRGAERFRWAERRREDAAFNASNDRFRRGTAVACAGHGNTYYPRYNDFASAEMRMCEDGSVQVEVSIHDHGCGTGAAFQMIVAEALELPLDKVRLKEADTAHTPFDFGCYASRGIFVVGRAAQLCARSLREEILKAAAHKLETTPDRLYFEGPAVRSEDDPAVSLSYQEVAWYSLGTLCRELTAQAKHTVDSNPGVTGTHFAQVEVDTWTGLTRVLDYLAVHDVGQSINPEMCAAQIQGAAQMGCGAALREEIEISPKGQGTCSLSKYHLMNAADLPLIQVELIQDGRSQDGPYGAKSVGEVSFAPAAPAAAAAVNQALGSDLGRIPMTPDRILEYIAKEGC